ncbi:hypothetical protein [Dongia sedimenti]|uniref:Uncharacterized protein n=1 Tax=Dongia sedimenti TaxID=3064282 RepID=A0ABU0YV55_9PROT|nr:hypothetical protein [Rhodospirillaceae bacterium R-7]
MDGCAVRGCVSQDGRQEHSTQLLSEISEEDFMPGIDCEEADAVIGVSMIAYTATDWISEGRQL